MFLKDDRMDTLVLFEKRDQYRHLNLPGMRVLSVPATSASVERAFFVKWAFHESPSQSLDERNGVENDAHSREAAFDVQEEHFVRAIRLRRLKFTGSINTSYISVFTTITAIIINNSIYSDDDWCTYRRDSVNPMKVGDFFLLDRLLLIILSDNTHISWSSAVIQMANTLQARGFSEQLSTTIHELLNLPLTPYQCMQLTNNYQNVEAYRH